MLERKEIGRMTEEEFLVFIENDSTDRLFEYVNGLVYSMAPTNVPHGTIAMNLGAFFHPKLRGTRCRVVGQGPKVRIKAANSYLVPDIFIWCSHKIESDRWVDDPVLVIEVLSQSTRAFDRGDKRLLYQHAASLREYFVVHQDRQQVERWARNGDEWEEHRFTPVEGAVPILSLPCGELKLPFELIYEGCEPPSRVKEEEPPYVTGSS